MPIISIILAHLIRTYKVTITSFQSLKNTNGYLSGSRLPGTISQSPWTQEVSVRDGGGEDRYAQELLRGVQGHCSFERHDIDNG
jgi:hypothetical protein